MQGVLSTKCYASLSNNLFKFVMLNDLAFVEGRSLSLKPVSPLIIEPHDKCLNCYFNKNQPTARAFSQEKFWFVFYTSCRSSTFGLIYKRELLVCRIN